MHWAPQAPSLGTARAQLQQTLCPPSMQQVAQAQVLVPGLALVPGLVLVLTLTLALALALVLALALAQPPQKEPAWE